MGGGMGGACVSVLEVACLEVAMSSHASRSSLIVSEDGDASPHSSPKQREAGDEGGRPVPAVALALHHSLSPRAGRAALFDHPPPQAHPNGGGANGGGANGGGAAGGVMASIEEGKVRPSLGAAERRATFWLVQLASLLFTATNVGLTDVLPVWLASPPTPTPDGGRGGGGLSLHSSEIGQLQSCTGFGNIALALFFTYRVIRWCGPVGTFVLSLHANALAAFCTPAISLLPAAAPPACATALVSASYVLVAAARNMGFATAIMLSKESAPGAPGVAIGINQSACSLGSAIGPILCGVGYAASLARLATSAPFFVALGLVALAPGAATQALAPRWPW